MSKDQQQSGRLRKRKRDRGYFQIENEPIQRPDMSLKAKGLLSYLMSLPEDWKLYKSELRKNHSDGKDSIDTAFKELEKNMYVVTIESRNEKGHFIYEYMFDDIPFTASEVDFHRGGFPAADKPQRENRSGKPATINKIYTNKTKTNKQKMKEEEEKAAAEIKFLNELTEAGFEENEIIVFNKEINSLGEFDKEELSIAIIASIKDFEKGQGLGNPGKWLAGKLERVLKSKDKYKQQKPKQQSKPARRSFKAPSVNVPDWLKPGKAADNEAEPENEEENKKWLEELLAGKNVN